MMDVKTADGSVVKITTALGDQDIQSMYKVSAEDLSQLLAYHEVFGKLNSEASAPKV